MNRRDFFRRAAAAFVAPILGNADIAEPTPVVEPSKPTSYTWHIADGAPPEWHTVTMPVRPMSEQEVAAIVQRELIGFLSDI